MTNRPSHRLLDTRVIQRNIRRGLVAKAEVVEYMEELPDVTENILPATEGGDDDGYEKKKPKPAAESVSRTSLYPYPSLSPLQPLPIRHDFEEMDEDEDEDEDEEDDHEEDQEQDWLEQPPSPENTSVAFSSEPLPSEPLPSEPQPQNDHQDPSAESSVSDEDPLQ